MRIFRKMSSPTFQPLLTAEFLAREVRAYRVPGGRSERCRLSNLSKDTNTLDERLEINYAEGIITAADRVGFSLRGAMSEYAR